MRDLRLTALFFFCFGCHASVQADANASTSGQGDADLDAEVQKERAMAPVAGTLPAASAAPESTAPAPLLGARSDLTLVQADVKGQCSCLRVVLGAATLGAFHWTGERPAVDDQTQLTLAFTSQGSGCQDPKGSLGASYWGYKRSGDDIVVYVENGVEGRPVTTGAIIPKPVGAGQVYVSPVNKKVPYGAAPDGKGRCKIGNPGAPRTAPVTGNEMGAGQAPPPGAPDDALSNP